VDWDKFLKDNRKPLYQQIQTLILQAIRTKELQPDDQIPSAGVLGKKWGISRMTVIQAFQELQRRGVLYTVSGKGTFISQPRKMVKPLEKPYGFTEECDLLKLAPTSKLIKFETKSADVEVANLLQIEPGMDVYTLSRIRFMDGKINGVEYANLSADRFPDLDRFDWEHESLYNILRSYYHADIDHAVHDIEASIADDEMCRWLNVPRHFPVLITRRYTYTSLNEIIECVDGIYRSDRVRLRMGNIEKHPMNIHLKL
jgi:GntR family transcriptional regulator